MAPTLTFEQEILLGAALDNLSSAAAADRLARAGRVLNSIQTGSCKVLPATGAFGRSTPAVAKAAAQILAKGEAKRAWDARKNPRAARPAGATTRDYSREAYSPFAQDGRGAATLGDLFPQLADVTPTTPATRPALPSGAECRAKVWQAKVTAATAVAVTAYRSLPPQERAAAIADLLADPAMVEGLAAQAGGL